MTLPSICTAYQADPIKLAKELWPNDIWTVEQQQITYSLWDNIETVVVAANGMGKDFIAGRSIVLFIVSRHPVRVVTTSATAQHLAVLWGEINAAIDACRYPLRIEQGGILRVTDLNITKWIHGKKCPLSYVTGMVASEQTEAALGGHWIAERGDGIPRTMFVGDECSSVPNRYYKVARPWSRRRFFFGNAWPCDNFFKHAVEGKPGTDDVGGDMPSSSGKGLFRKVFQLSAETSPNVKLAQWQIKQGLEPTGEIVVPGVRTWDSFEQDRKTLQPDDASVILYGKWYKGKEVRLFPKEWMDHAEVLASLLRKSGRRRKAKAGGCDPGEGSANTAFVAGDELGVLALESVKTPDTNDIFDLAINFMEKHQIPAHRFCIDRGGGGKQLADRLRAKGYAVRTIAFGESISPLPTRLRAPIGDRVDIKEDRYTFVNRRAQLYGELSEVLDPNWQWQWVDDQGKVNVASGFALPREYFQFRKQLEPIPKKRDPEGRLILPPKHKKDQNDKQVTLVDLIGHSPDEADALVLMLHALLHPARRPIVMVG